MGFVVVPGEAIAGVYNAGEMPETVMVQFARNFVVDLANCLRRKVIFPLPAYLFLARFERLERLELVWRRRAG